MKTMKNHKTANHQTSICWHCHRPAIWRDCKGIHIIASTRAQIRGAAEQHTVGGSQVVSQQLRAHSHQHGPAGIGRVKKRTGAKSGISIDSLTISSWKVSGCEASGL